MGNARAGHADATDATSPCQARSVRLSVTSHFPVPTSHSSLDCLHRHPGCYARSSPLTGEPMALKLKPLNEQVIVITGASSGIGLTTAQCAAKQGAKVVLAARSEETM